MKFRYQFFMFFLLLIVIVPHSYAYLRVNMVFCLDNVRSEDIPQHVGLSLSGFSNIHTPEIGLLKTIAIPADPSIFTAGRVCSSPQIIQMTRQCNSAVPSQRCNQMYNQFFVLQVKGAYSSFMDASIRLDLWCSGRGSASCTTGTIATPNTSRPPFNSLFKLCPTDNSSSSGNCRTGDSGQDFQINDNQTVYLFLNRPL
jgi:hypothetical protein